MTTETPDEEQSMTRTEQKQKAQNELMAGMQAALSNLDEEGQPEIYAAAVEQFRRVEKMFGYVPGSFSAGV